jgi:hypothetical protein
MPFDRHEDVRLMNGSFVGKSLKSGIFGRSGDPVGHAITDPIVG